MERRRKRRERRREEEEVEVPPGFSDENQVWLKPAEGQRRRELLGGSDAEMSCEEEEGKCVCVCVRARAYVRVH